MFFIKHEYEAAAAEQFCLQHGLTFTRGMYILKRFEEETLTGWAVFCINGQRVRVMEMCPCSPMEADLFIRSGINAARLRGCKDFCFEKMLWDRLAKELISLGYTNCPIEIDNFLASCGKK